MLLYNVSIIIEETIQEDIFSWLTQEVQQQAGARLLEMIDSPHEGVTYCIHITSEDEETITVFQRDVVSKIQQHLGEHYKDKAFIFDSKLKYVSIDR